MAAPIYKQFAYARTAFYLLVLALSLGFSGVSRAETNPAYTVEGVEVDVTAENAVKAREKALDEAQVKAYRMLAERFLSPEEMAAFKDPDPITVSTLVQDFEVVKEQLSTKRYKGTYTIRFRPNAMRASMASKGVTYSDVPKKPVLVLPFYEEAGSTVLWSDANPWMRAWKMLPQDKSMMQPTVVPLGDSEDIAQVGDADGLDYDTMGVQELASRYNADDVAVVVASTEPTQTVEGRLGINIYTNGFEGPTFVQKIVVDQQPGETPEALYARAAAKVKSVLRGNWKANAAYVQTPAQPQTTTTVTQTTYGHPPVYAPQTGAAPIPYTRPVLGPSTVYNAHARFSSVQDWVRIKSTLDRTYGVQAVVIKALKPREALVDIRFAGNVSALQTALQNGGITLRAGNGGAPLELYMGPARQPVYR